MECGHCVNFEVTKLELAVLYVLMRLDIRQNSISFETKRLQSPSRNGFNGVATSTTVYPHFLSDIQGRQVVRLFNCSKDNPTNRGQANLAPE
jgi:hypothetical protein